MHDYSIMLELISKLEANTADILNLYSIREKGTTLQSRDVYELKIFKSNSSSNLTNKTDFEILNERAKLNIFKSESNRVLQKTGLMQFNERLILPDIKLAHEYYLILLGALIHRRLRIDTEFTTQKSELSDDINKTLGLDEKNSLDPYTIYKALVAFRKYMELNIKFEGKECKRYMTLVHYSNSNFIENIEPLIKNAKIKAQPYLQAWDIVFFVQSLARQVDERKNYSANTIKDWVSYLRTQNLNWEQLNADDIERYLNIYLQEKEKNSQLSELNYIKYKLKNIWRSFSVGGFPKDLDAELFEQSLLSNNNDYYCYVICGAGFLLHHCINTRLIDKIPSKKKGLFTRLLSKPEPVVQVESKKQMANNVMGVIKSALGIDLVSCVDEYDREYLDWITIFKEFYTVEFELGPPDLKEILNKIPPLNLSFFRDQELNFIAYLNDTHDLLGAMLSSKKIA